jgi:capsular polysaccharide biosynthesis protein
MVFSMRGPLNHYLMLVRRWAWLIVLGVVVCGGITYVISQFTQPTYQATVTFVVNIHSSSSTDVIASIAAVPTYAQLLTNPLVLNAVVAKHRGMTLQQLNAMITVKPQMNMQLIELDVQSNDPHLATQVANEVGQSYLLYTKSELSETLHMLPAQVPSDPIKPKPSQDAGIAALIGLGLAVTLIVAFEWGEDRLSSPKQGQPNYQERESRAFNNPRKQL